MARVADILEAAMRLDESERAELLEALSASLYGRDLGEDWEAEIERRVEDLETGRVKTVGGDEVFAGIERRLRER
jgi:putative addiction module component (TIGR02574 family)